MELAGLFSWWIFFFSLESVESRRLSRPRDGGQRLASSEGTRIVVVGLTGAQPEREEPVLTLQRWAFFFFLFFLLLVRLCPLAPASCPLQ